MASPQPPCSRILSAVTIWNASHFRKLVLNPRDANVPRVAL